MKLMRHRVLFDFSGPEQGKYCGAPESCALNYSISAFRLIGGVLIRVIVCAELTHSYLIH